MTAEGTTGRQAYGMRPWLAGLLLGLGSAVLCATPAAFYGNPLMWLARVFPGPPSFVAAQLAFSGPGLVFGIAFATLVVWRGRAPRAAFIWLPLASALVWLGALNLGAVMINTAGPGTALRVWAGPLCGGLAGLLAAALAALVVSRLRSLAFVLGAALVGGLAGAIPVDWARFRPEFNPGWAALYVAWQCGILVLAGAVLARRAQPAAV